MKVLLISPYYTNRENDQRHWPAEPLGLLYVGTYLAQQAKREGKPIEVKILDAQLEGPPECIVTERGYRSGMSDEELEATVRDFAPDVVGMCMNYTFGVQDVLDAAAVIKRTVPAARVVVGGAHATLDHPRIALHPLVDYVVRGEGEHTFHELCGVFANGGDVSKVAGLTYRPQASASVKINPERHFIENLDALPIPDRGLLDYPRYLSKHHYFHTRQKPVATIFTARGCPFKCVFCSTVKTWGNDWRARSAESILQEAKYLRDTYGVKEIAFQDDQLLKSPQRIIEFCKLAVKENLGMNFTAPPGMSPCFMSEELFDWMAKAGFYRLCFSVDTGTEGTTKYVGKPVTLAKIRPLVKAANRRGLWTFGTFVIGFPHETKEDIAAAVKYAYGLKLDFLRFYIAQPYFGSDLYYEYEQAGKLAGVNLFEPHDNNDAYVGTQHISVSELVDIRNRAETGYHYRHYVWNYLNPVYLWTEFLPKISSGKRFNYFFGLVWRLGAIRLHFKSQSLRGY
jgi:radical SAM superfamily enzyme YgiQ (UPF0313 family)